MKKTLFFGALFALFAFASCEREVTQPVVDDGTKSVALSLNFGSVGTKGVIDGDLQSPYNKDVTAFENIQIYFTDANGGIRYAFQAESNATENTDAKTIWDGLVGTSKAGVKFVGMKGVSRVYMTANAPGLSGLNFNDGAYIETADVASQNVSAIKFNLENYSAKGKSQAQMVFAGADETLVSAVTVADDAGEVTIDGAAGTGAYFSAEIAIRPALSRMEIESVHAEATGEKYVKEENGVYVLCDKNDAKYKVAYSNFNIELVGVYMSSFYKTMSLFPAKSDVTTFTDTFGGETLKTAEGKWNVPVDGTGLSDKLNTAVSYSNWDATAKYSAITTVYTSATDGNLFYSKTDADKKVIPFHFFVPYNVTNDSNTNGALENVVTPRFHLQLKKNDTQNTTVTIYEDNDGDKAFDDQVTDEKITTAIGATFTWPFSTDSDENTAYANIKMVDAENSTTEVTLQPGYIYRMQKVIITPNVTIVGTVPTDEQNVYVVVTVVPWAEQNVYPGFE